jgi:hypothetical protein
MLINAVKDVASALGDLIQATKAASGKSINDPSMNHLKDSAKVCHHNNIYAWHQERFVITGDLVDGFIWMLVSHGLHRPYNNKPSVSYSR